MDVRVQLKWNVWWKNVMEVKCQRNRSSWSLRGSVEKRCSALHCTFHFSNKMSYNSLNRNFVHVTEHGPWWVVLRVSAVCERLLTRQGYILRLPYSLHFSHNTNPLHLQASSFTVSWTEPYSENSLAQYGTRYDTSESDWLVLLKPDWLF